MKKVNILNWNQLESEAPAYALVANVDLVVIRWKDEEQVSVLYTVGVFIAAPCWPMVRFAATISFAGFIIGTINTAVE